MNVTRTLSILAAALLSPAALAQWTSNSALNTAIADAAVTDEQPKVAATSDGGCYISWFSTPGYDVRLQRLDADGNEQWAHNGILVADRGFSSTQDYDLAVDGSDNALLAFRDDRFGGTKITAQMIAPDGTSPWGANGVQFDDGIAFVAAPKIAAATDGSVFVAWSHDNATHVHKVTAAGALAWLSATVLPNAENFMLASDMHASDSGSVIVAAIGYASFPAAKHLYAHKVSADGSTAWAGWTSVMDNNSLQFGNFPKFVPDGAGGAVFAWYTTGTGLQCWVQRVRANGNEVFADNGVAVSTAVGDRVSPSVCFNADTAEAYVFWTELQNNQSEYAVYGQMVDGDGTRQWTDGGLVVAPFSSNVSGGINSMAAGCGAVVFYGEELSLGNDRIHAVRLDADGNELWTPGTLTVASAATGKARLTSASAGNGGLLAWTDSGAGATDVFAQRVNLDGTLGLPPAEGDATGDGNVNVDDLVDVITYWGECCGCTADVNFDGTVDVNDLVLVITNWS